MRIHLSALLPFALLAACSGGGSKDETSPRAPVVTGVATAALCDGGADIVVTGKGFLPSATVTLSASGGGTLSCTAASVSPDGTEIVAACPAGAVPGTAYDVVVHAGSVTDAAPHQQVTGVAGPVAFFASPPAVLGGLETRVKLYAAPLPVPASSVAIVPHGATSSVTQLAFDAVAGHPRQLEAIVPATQGDGSYDLVVTDANGCRSVLGNAVSVVSTLTVTLERIAPAFAWSSGETSLTIFRNTTAPAPGNQAFVATPWAFLVPQAAANEAIPLRAVSFVDGATLTAVVPAGVTPGTYGLAVVNPDGSAGMVSNAVIVGDTPAPTIARVTPSSLASASGQQVTVTGTGFQTGQDVALSCSNGAILTATAGSVDCTGAPCTQAATIDAGGLWAGVRCILTVTRLDGATADYSAIGVTSPSLNLSTMGSGGPALNVGRRALVAAAAEAAPGARFLYAIGGDAGTGSGDALDSVEMARIDEFGGLGPWTLAAGGLPSARTLAAVATVGRYVYVLGGDDGTGPLQSAVRAMVLDPRETPSVALDDLVVSATGLDAGDWYYRISALSPVSDLDNPSGESLPSSELHVTVPAIWSKVQAVLTWTPPVDSLGVPLPVDGYQIYRTPEPNAAPGSEELLATVSGSVFAFTDDGSAAPQVGQTPLPLGSLGQWTALPQLASARSGAAGAAAFDPADASRAYVYALLGSSGAGLALSNYEYLPITMQPNGRQRVAPSWSVGSSTSPAPRWQLGAWVVDGTVQANYAAETWIFLGGGKTGAGTLDATVEAGKVSSGGDLGTFSATPKDFSQTAAGYGVCAANRHLYLFGGTGAAPSSGAKVGVLYDSLMNPLAPPTLATSSWNPEGMSMTHGRYLMGSAVNPSFVFLVGGQTDESSAASRTTEFVTW